MIIEYLKANARFSLILLVSTVICALIITLIVIFYKKSKTNISNDLPKNDKNCENSAGILDCLANVSDSKEEKDLSDESTQSSNVSENNKSSVELQNKGENPDEIYSFEQITLPKEESNVTLAILEEKKDLPLDNEIIVDNTADKEPSALIQKPIVETAPAKSESVKYAGKWIIYEEDGRFFAELKASNGEVMLRTEYYSSLSGIKSGIETLKKNIEMENYAINLDKNGNFVFKIFSTAKRLLCIGEGYSTREQCEKAFNSVKRFSQTAKIVVNGK